MSADGDVLDLVSFVARGLVTEPDAVRARMVDGVIELETAAEDRGRVIGRQGRVAKALRALLAASGHDPEYRLEVVD